MAAASAKGRTAGAVGGCIGSGVLLIQSTGVWSLGEALKDSIKQQAPSGCLLIAWRTTPSCPALSFIVIVTELSFTELKAQ